MRRPFLSQARRQASDPAARRRAWAALLANAEALGRTAAGGRAIDKERGIQFAGQVVRTGELAFPPPWASARSAADGFRHLARGFIAAAQPELKAALGQAMAAAAACCARMLELETETAAAELRRRTGEREDD